MGNEELTLRIKEAFATVARPEKEQIAPHLCDECGELCNNFAPYTPESIPEKILKYHTWDLPLLSAQAKQYFLPAWLYAGLKDKTSDFVDAVKQNIDSNQRYDPPGGYTEEQWQVLLDFLDESLIN